MREFFRIWDIAYLPYLIISFILFFRFVKKSATLKKELSRSEGLLIILFWPSFYPLYSYRLRKNPKGA